MQANEKRILIITIPPHPYLLSLSKDLQLKKRTDKKGMAYFRIGEQINIASPEVIAAFEQKLGKNNEAGTTIINNDNTKVAMQNSTNHGTQTFNF